MSLEQKKLPLHSFKMFAIGILLVLLLLNTTVGFDFSTLIDFKIVKIGILLWGIGYINVVIIAFFLHYSVYYITLKRLDRLEKKLSFWECVITCLKIRKGNIFLYLMSPDYLFAHKFKEILYETHQKDLCEMREDNKDIHNYHGDNIKCEYYSDIQEYECEIYQRKKRRKLFIICCNWSNVLLVSILTIFMILFSPHDILDETYKKIMFTTIVLHTFSRVVEICYAFYNDVVTSRMKRNLDIGEKASTLKRGNRISLAVHSYFEVALLFAIIYYLNPLVLENPNLIDSILYSFSVSAFNFSFVDTSLVFGKMLHVSQVFTNITLVVLSIANYLGMEDKMSEYEKADWKAREYI